MTTKRILGSLLSVSLTWSCCTWAVDAAPKDIKVCRIGSSSFSSTLIEYTRLVVESSGNYTLICEKGDSTGYTRLDRFVSQPGLYEEWCKEELPRVLDGKYDFVIRHAIRQHFDRQKAKAMAAEFVRYWDENNNKPRDDIYFEAKLLEAKMAAAGDRDEVKRLGETIGLIEQVIAIPAWRILLANLPEDVKQQQLANIEITGGAKRSLPLYAAYVNEHLSDEVDLFKAWDVYLDIWNDPDLTDRLKESNFDKAVFIEAEKAFVERVAE